MDQPRLIDLRAISLVAQRVSLAPVLPPLLPASTLRPSPSSGPLLGSAAAPQRHGQRH